MKCFTLKYFGISGFAGFCCLESLCQHLPVDLAFRADCALAQTGRSSSLILEASLDDLESPSHLEVPQGLLCQFHKCFCTVHTVPELTLKPPSKQQKKQILDKVQGYRDHTILSPKRRTKQALIKVHPGLMWALYWLGAWLGVVLGYDTSCHLLRNSVLSYYNIAKRSY